MVRRMCVAGMVCFLAGCAQVGDGSVKHSSFYESHQMLDFFQKAVARENTPVECNVTGDRTTGTAGDKSLSIRFKGDDETRGRIVREYKRYAMSELQAADLSPYENPPEDVVRQNFGEKMLWDFDILYSTNDGRTDGLLRTSSAVDQRGCVVIEVHLVEYKGHISR